MRSDIEQALMGPRPNPLPGREGNARSAAAILLAAGAATRMGFDKLWADLAGQPVLLHALRTFERARSIEIVVLVTRPDRVADCLRLADEHRLVKLHRVVSGGARRQDSVRAGLDALPHDACDVVAVHDAARPLVDTATIDEGVRRARDRGAVVAGLPLVDTVKRVDADYRVVETPPRSTLWAVQTPQTFRLDLLCRAHTAIADDVTDDAQMVEQIGHPVWVYPGTRRNLKITTPEDLIVAEALLRAARG